MTLCLQHQLLSKCVKSVADTDNLHIFTQDIIGIAIEQLMCETHFCLTGGFNLTDTFYLFQTPDNSYHCVMMIDMPQVISLSSRKSTVYKQYPRSFAIRPTNAH
jgi:hypothetical protein